MAQQEKDNNSITFTMERHFGVLSTAASGWRTELNLVSWNGMEPRYDIRDWSPTYHKMSKGITLTPDEASILAELLPEAVKERTISFSDISNTAK